jgi:hypothetical protein
VNAEGTAPLTQPVESLEETPVATSEAEAPAADAGSEAPELDQEVQNDDTGDTYPQDKGR